MDFTKMTGAGNDFIVLGADSGLPPKPEAIRLLCDRRYGVGADGLMVIAGSVSGGRPEPSFSVDFYNADGSGGMLCGNGARCALVYSAARGLIAYGRPVAFSFAGKLYTGTAIAPDRARFMLDPHYTTRLEDMVQTDTANASGRYVDLGSLHFVVDLADLKFAYREARESRESWGSGASSGPGLSGGSSVEAGTWGLPLDQLDVASLGAALRHHERFAPSGVNVNFCSLIDSKIHVRTFERGVEAETLACGTGSTASALSYALRGLVRPPVRIVTRSAEELIIDFDDPAKPSRLSLEGSARVVFEGWV